MTKDEAVMLARVEERLIALDDKIDVHILKEDEHQKVTRLAIDELKTRWWKLVLFVVVVTGGANSIPVIGSLL